MIQNGRLVSEANPIVEKYITQILKRRDIRIARTYGGPLTFFDLSITKNSRRCKCCEKFHSQLATELASTYSTIIVKFVSPVEFWITYRMVLAKGNVRSGWNFEEWQHKTTIDLSDPASFTKLQEFITRHLPRGKNK